MNTSALSLRDLEYILAVKELGHFGRAAKKVGVSQPALSTQIKKIESLLGITFFERTQRTVRVNPDALPILDQIALTWEEAGKIIELSSSKPETLSGPLKLGAIQSSGPYLIPKILPGILKKYPDLQIFIKESLTDLLVQGLIKGELDLALVSPTFSEPGLRYEPFFFEPFHIALPKAHPLSKLKHLRPQDLDPSEMILLEDGHCLRDQTLELCARPKREKRGEKNILPPQASSLDTIKSLVAAGRGYALIPELALPTPNELKPLLEFKPLVGSNGKPLSREIGFCFRKNSPKTGSYMGLVEFLKSRYFN